MHKTDWKFLLSLDASPRPAMAYDLNNYYHSAHHCRKMSPWFSHAAAWADGKISWLQMARMDGLYGKA